MTIDDRLRELHLELPPAPTSKGTYLTAVRHGDLLYVAGHGPLRPDGTYVTGRLGADMTVEDGRAAARLVALAVLATVREKQGSLDAIDRVVKVLGFVQSTADFTQHPAVINGFSDLLVEVLGDAGVGVRSAVGAPSLPMGIAVEIEAIFAVRR